VRLRPNRDLANLGGGNLISEATRYPLRGRYQQVELNSAHGLEELQSKCQGIRLVVLQVDQGTQKIDSETIALNYIGQVS
jgi:hypothetical protein